MILEAKPKHLNKIVVLHRKVLPNTSSSLFGFHFVKNLYSHIMTDRNSKTWVYEKDDEVLGFLSISSKVLSTTKLLRKSITLSDCLDMMSLFLRKPYQLIIFIRRLIFDSKIINTLRDYPSILTIGVSPDARKMGIGTKLITYADRYFDGLKKDRYFVDTEQNNTSAINFYKKNGFRIIMSYKNHLALEKNFKNEQKHN